MPLPPNLEGRLRIPVVAAPMFLVSGPALVVSACKAGVLGTFPALNQRSSAGFDDWLAEIGSALAAVPSAAPYGVNLIVHRTNPRVDADLALCVKHKVPVVITSLGAVADLVKEVHGYGGVVFHDVINRRHAEKAAEAGVDGLILVCAGAGGHAGTYSPFAFLPEIRRFFDKTVLLAGAISDGRSVAAARVLGADLAYMGTRFIATKESLAVNGFKEMILAGNAADVVYTPAISGIHGSFLKESIRSVGLDPDNLPTQGQGYKAKVGDEQKAWKHVWSAGQGIGSIDDVPSVPELVDRLEREYLAALADVPSRR
ncbi:MAG: nitronate monooxygenase [Rhodospirillales bacterium]|nr:nitronate monooxygenase [Rhodospirillales bacterium]